MTGRLAGRNAIITGGGSGIGLSTAHSFGREGARLAILDLDGERAVAAAGELHRDGIEAFALAVDVADEAGVAAAFREIDARFGGSVHVLVNNAGIAEFASVEESSLESFQRIMAVNLTGTFLCSKAALPALRKSGGSIVNIASIAGIIGIPGMPAYCASKAAVIGLTRQMAVDYAGSGIRVNCVNPGRIAGTELDRWIIEQDSEEATRAKLAKYPLGRFGTPEEIAEAVLFLASGESAFVTGTALTIDGGMTAL
jgi:NAD(P)-dependent dehydrogenase (short-subunit alcohol dehydrogenase family)